MVKKPFDFANKEGEKMHKIFFLENPFEAKIESFFSTASEIEIVNISK